MQQIEVKCEGPLVILYEGNVAKEAYLMHEIGERQALLIKAATQVREWHALENREREALRMNTVTLESFTKKIAGPNVFHFMFFDGSRTHPVMWPDLAKKEESETFKAAIL